MICPLCHNKYLMRGIWHKEGEWLVRYGLCPCGGKAVYKKQRVKP